LGVEHGDGGVERGCSGKVSSHPSGVLRAEATAQQTPWGRVSQAEGMAEAEAPRWGLACCGLEEGRETSVSGTESARVKEVDGGWYGGKCL
jgi:hypothetical protein